MGKKWQFLLIFIIVYILIADILYWVGGLKQIQKCADVVYEFRNANIQPALLSSQLPLKWRARAEHTSLTL